MARNQKSKNPIIAAGERLEEEEPLLDEQYGEDDDGEDDEGQPYDVNEVTVDEMNEAMAALPQAQRARVDATRKPGKSPHKHSQTHVGRARQETRAPRARDRAVEWKPADTLYAPPPRPGMEQRWIRTRLGEKDDPRNFQKKFREGWKPIRLEDVPEDMEPPSEMFGRFGAVVAISDLVLCERPIEIGLSRKRFFQKKLQRQLDSADRRHVNKVQRDDHVIRGGARSDMKPSVGRGVRNRAAPVQDDNG